MDTARHILLLLLAFVLQTTWVHLFEIAGLKPDLVLLVLVYTALRSGPVESTLLGFGIGFIQDLYAPADLGLNALTKSVVGFSVGYGRSGVVAESVWVQVSFLVGGVLVHDLLYYLGSSAVDLADVPFFWLRYGPGSALYTGALGAALSGLLLVRRRLLSL